MSSKHPNNDDDERTLLAVVFSAFYLADDGVVGGGDRVEDPLDALQRLLIAGGDPVKGFVVVLQGTAALAAGDKTSASVCTAVSAEGGWGVTHMSTGSATSMYLIFISLGKSISSFTSQSLLTSTEESLGFSWAKGHVNKC